MSRLSEAFDAEYPQRVPPDPRRTLSYCPTQPGSNEKSSYAVELAQALANTTSGFEVNQASRLLMHVQSLYEDDRFGGYRDVVTELQKLRERSEHCSWSPPSYLTQWAHGVLAEVARCQSVRYYCCRHRRFFEEDPETAAASASSTDPRWPW